MIRIGSFTLNNRPSGKDYNISETSVHPDYKFTEAYDDVAVIKLRKSISFSSSVRPICLSFDDGERYDGKTARVIGWGAEEVGKYQWRSS